MILDATTKSLEIVLGTAHATVECDITASWGDYTSTSFTPGAASTVSNGTTAVTAAAAPAAATQRLVQEVTVYNADTVPHVVILQLHDGANVRVVRRRTIGPGEDFAYAPSGATLAVRLP